MSDCLSFKIVSVDKEKVEVEIENQRLVLPSKYFSVDTSVKDRFQLFFLNLKNPEVSDKHLAKLILEEILNGK